MLFCNILLRYDNVCCQFLRQGDGWVEQLPLHDEALTGDTNTHAHTLRRTLSQTQTHRYTRAHAHTNDDNLTGDVALPRDLRMGKFVLTHAKPIGEGTSGARSHP